MYKDVIHSDTIVKGEMIFSLYRLLAHASSWLWGMKGKCGMKGKWI